MPAPVTAVSPTRRTTIQWPRKSRWWLLLALTMAGCGRLAQNGQGPVLTSVSQIRSLSASQTEMPRPVRVVGHVVYSDAVRKVLFVEDSTGGVRVETPTAVEYKPRQNVEVTGIVGATSPSPLILNATVKLLPGQAARGESLLRPGNLALPENQYRRVELRGIVRGAAFAVRNRLRLGVRAGGKDVVLWGPLLVNSDQSNLIDAEVRIQGLLDIRFDESGASGNVRLWSAEMDDIIVERKAEDPSRLPVRTIQSLHDAVQEALPTHRVRVRGSLLLGQESSGFLLKDGGAALPVENDDGMFIRQSEAEVDVLGFLDRKDGNVILRNALLAPWATADSDTRLRPLEPRVLTEVAQVHAVPLEQSIQHFPVHLRGILTFYTPRNGALFLQDSTGAVFVRGYAGKGPLRAGQKLEIDGVTTVGGFAPNVQASQVKVIGEGAVPEPARSEPEQIFTGKLDSLWVEVSGVVRAVVAADGGETLDLFSGSHEIKALVLGAHFSDALVDSKVRVRGVCTSRFNSSGQLVGVGVQSPDPTYVQIEGAAIEAFSKPLQPIRDLLQFTLTGDRGRRQTIRGTVTKASLQGPTYVQDASGAVQIRDHRSAVLHPGDVVEAAGFPEASSFGAVLRNATIRKIASGTPPRPTRVTAGEALEDEYDSKLVEIDAILVDQVPGQRLLAKAGGKMFNIRTSNIDGLPSLERGSLLRLVGICSLEAADSAEVVAQGLTLLLRSAKDVTTLRAASWWTSRHLLELLGAAGVILFAVFAWVLVLRRRVEQQTAVIQERLEREALLSQQYSELFESAGDMVYQRDLAGRFTAVNPAGERITGYTREELVGKSIFDLTPPEQQFNVEKHNQDLSTGDHRVNYELEIVAKNGGRITLEVSARTVFEGNRPIRVDGIARDITVRRQGQLELERAKRSAEDASRSKSEFLANMSHEIRTPLNGILGMTDLALDTDLRPEQRECLTMVKQSGDSLLNIVNDILDFSKIEAGRLELDISEFDLNESLECAIRTVAIPAHQKGLELTFENDVQMLAMAVGDSGRIRQIVINLLGNAVKFTPSGEVRLHVSEISRDGNNLVAQFTVSDTGIGISPEWQERIFDAFVQADASTTRYYGGTGLGLAICSKLVALMGGRIWMESQLGEGSSFHFTVNLGISTTECQTLPDPEPEMLHGLSVLVVDDSATNLRILREAFLKWRMNPVLAESGPRALEVLRHYAEAGKPFDLVLLDAHMPGMDGFTLARRIREDPSLAGPRIMMSSSVDVKSLPSDLAELGVAQYVVKPVTREDLLKAILKVMGSRQTAAAERQVIAGEDPIRPLRVLVAEDNPINQRVAVLLLERKGHSVVIASNGSEALSAMERESFDLVLMDVQMPLVSGYEATREIRRCEEPRGQHTPIIALTAHAIKGDREICLEAGMDDYLSKPIQPQCMDEILARWGAPQTIRPGGRA